MLAAEFARFFPRERLCAELQARSVAAALPPDVGTPIFCAYLKKLEKKKPVIFCGDLNVAHTEIDLANPKANIRNHGFTIEERNGFTRLRERRVPGHLPRI